HQLRDPGRSDDETRQDPQHADASRERRQLAALLVDPEGERRRRAERISGGRERDDPEHGHDRAADARRTERLPRGGPHLGPARDHRRGHARAPSTAGPVGVRGARRRQIERTNPGAATNMITSAWMKNSRSSGMPVWTCIRPPPVLSAPNKSAARTMRNGRLPASRASAIALNPKPELMSFDICGTVPSTSIDPPSAARAPDNVIARMIDPLALIPAYLAAVRLKPAARSSKPFVVLNRNHETTTAMTNARTNPQCRGMLGMPHGSRSTGKRA